MQMRRAFAGNDKECKEGDVMTMKRTILTGLTAASLVLESGLAFAAGQYGPGVSDTEIKIGQTMPYSGPASALGAIGKAEAAYLLRSRISLNRLTASPFYSIAPG
jgi:hypothetical protein